MTFRPVLLAACAFAAGFLSISAASAAEARATTSVNVRSGPGTSYRVVDVLRTGERVEVDRCTRGWCRIEHNGPDGWVSDNYLSTAGSDRPRRDRSRDRTPVTDPDIGFCIDGPNFSFGVNCNDDDTPEPDRGRRARSEVCFYSETNYRGDAFCARPGEADTRLSRRWNDRISSIEVRGNASALVCEDFYYRGRCADVTRSVRRLGSGNNDIISSYRVSR